jgi:hypothetical protein
MVTLKYQVNSLVLMVGTNDFILTWMSRNLWESQFERAGINDCRFICQSDILSAQNFKSLNQWNISNNFQFKLLRWVLANVADLG